MSNPSQTPPLFAQSCREILKHLEGIEEAEAARMRRDAHALLDEFTAWLDEVPTPTARVTAINKLFALYREAFSFRINK